MLERNIELQNAALEGVKLEKKAARATELAVQRFEAEMLKNRSRRYDVEQQRIEAEDRSDFLIGRFPQPIVRDASRFRETGPRFVGAGWPSSLLENRSEVRAAARRLEARWSTSSR